MVESFNASQDTYEIQGVLYQRDGTEESREDLFADLRSGGGLDIIAANTFFISQQDDEAKQYLEDLRPWIDADEDLSWESFVSSVMDIYAPGGKLYVPPADFALGTLHVRVSVGKDTLFYKDILDLADQYGIEKIEYYPYELGGFIIDQAIIDYVSGNGAEDKFRKALTLYKRFVKQTSKGGEMNPDGLMYYSHLYSFSDLQFWRTAFGEDVVLMGLPGQAGGSLICPVSPSYAMNKNSLHKDGVWEFIRVLLTADYQEEHSSFPSNKEAFEWKMEKALTVGGDEIVLPFTDEGDVTYSPVSRADVDTIVDYKSRILSLLKSGYISTFSREKDAIFFRVFLCQVV